VALLLALAAAGAHMLWPTAIGNLAPLSLLTMAHAGDLRLLNRLALPAAAAGLARRWRARLSADALARLTGAEHLVITESEVLTIGDPRLVELVGHGETRCEEVVRAAATLLRGRPSPLTDLLLAEAQNSKLALPKVDSVEALPGLGLVAQVGERRLALGGRALVEHLELALPEPLPEGLANPPAPDCRVWLVWADAELLGWLVVEDPARRETLGLVAKLAATNGPALHRLVEGDRVVAEREQIETAFHGLVVAPPAAQASEGVESWPLGATALLAPERLLWLPAQVRLAVTPEESAAGDVNLRPARLSALPQAWLEVGEAERWRRRTLTQLLVVHGGIAGAAFAGLPLGWVVLLDELTLMATLVLLRGRANEA
jgi:hypothetical protein